jgi:hypothetical protein
MGGADTLERVRESVVAAAETLSLSISRFGVPNAGLADDFVKLLSDGFQFLQVDTGAAATAVDRLATVIARAMRERDHDWLLSAARTGRVPAPALSLITKYALEEGTVTVSALVGKALNTPTPSLTTVSQLLSSMPDGFTILVKEALLAIFDSAHGRALRKLLTTVKVDQIGVTDVFVAGATLVADQKNGPAMFARWLSDQMARGKGEDTIVEVALKNTDEALRREAVERERQLSTLRSEAHDAREASARAEAVASELHDRLREAQRSGSSSSPRATDSDRLPYLTALAQLCDMLQQAGSSAAQISRAEATAAQFHLRRIGMPGSLTTARSEIFDFVGPYVPDGDEVEVLRSAWVRQSSDLNEQTLVRGVVRAKAKEGT